MSAQVVFEHGKSLEKTCAIQLTIEGYIIKVTIMAAESFLCLFLLTIILVLLKSSLGDLGRRF